MKAITRSDGQISYLVIIEEEINTGIFWPFRETMNSTSSLTNFVLCLEEKEKEKAKLNENSQGSRSDIFRQFPVVGTNP